MPGLKQERFSLKEERGGVLSKTADTKFIYAATRIRVIENRLLGEKDLNRIAEAQTPEQAFKVLLDAGYGTGSPISYDINGLDVLLNDEFKKVYSLLQEICPVPGIFEVFLQQYDFHNIKVILKAEYRGIKDYDRLLMLHGCIDIEELKEMLLNRKLGDMPPVMREAVEEAIADMSHIADPQAVDIIIDRACFRRMSEMATEIGNRSLIDFVAAKIDMLNIQGFIRNKKLKKDSDLFLRSMLPGGYISQQQFERIIDEPIEMLAKMLKETPYADMASLITENVVNNELTISVERFTEELNKKYIRIGKQKVIGLEPLIGYMLAKEEELRKVKEIMVKKLYEFSVAMNRDKGGDAACTR